MQKINLTFFLLIFQNFLLWFLVDNFWFTFNWYSIFYLIWFFNLFFLFVYLIDYNIQKRIEQNKKEQSDNFFPKKNIYKYIFWFLIFFTVFFSLLSWILWKYIYILFIILAFDIITIFFFKFTKRDLYFFKKPIIWVYWIFLLSFICANIFMYLLYEIDNVIFRIWFSCIVWIVVLLLWWFFVKINRILKSTMFRFYSILIVIFSFVLTIFVYGDLNSWFGMRNKDYQAKYFDDFKKSICRSISTQTYIDIGCDKIFENTSSNNIQLKNLSDSNFYYSWNQIENQTSWNIEDKSWFIDDKKDFLIDEDELKKITWDLEISWDNEQNLILENVDDNITNTKQEKNKKTWENLEKLVSYRDIFADFFYWQKYTWKIVKFKNISKDDPDYNFFAFAWKYRMIWLDISPNNNVYCQNYIVMKWILKGRNVNVSNPKNPFDPYRNEAFKLWELNNCIKWNFVKFKNL